MKSQLYAWVDFGANSKPTLKPEARDALLELEPEIMKRLRIKLRTDGFLGVLNARNPYKHAPLLDQLLQRDALEHRIV